MIIFVAIFKSITNSNHYKRKYTMLRNFSTRDLYSIQTGPKQVEFGHVYENPDTWEQRYEKKDHENKRFQGQVWYNE